MAPAALAIVQPPDPGRRRRPESRGTPRPIAPGESSELISKSQLINLAKAARAAFDAGLNAGQIPKGTKFDDWRHGSMDEVLGKVSFKELTQRDYLPMLAWWQDRAGESGKAMESIMRADSNPLRIARHKLEEALKKAKLPPAYVIAICRRQYKCELTEASVKQIWQLVYTINNRGKARAKKAEKARAQEPATPEEDNPF